MLEDAIKAPAELVDAFDRALRLANARLATHPWRAQADEVARAAAQADVGLRAIIAAPLAALCAFRPHVYEADEAYASAHDLYCAAACPLSKAAVELLAYAEVETYLVTHPQSPDVERLLRYDEARKRMRGSIVKLVFAARAGGAP
ncbi:MAG TPA: hypothetical protein VFS00_15205 [Polyangiaceae bacterium]|nr:hypothetical protein [Polyangiaceae bacterium]